MNSYSGKGWPATKRTFIFSRMTRTSASWTLSAVVSSGPTSRMVARRASLVGRSSLKSKGMVWRVADSSRTICLRPISSHVGAAFGLFFEEDGGGLVGEAAGFDEDVGLVGIADEDDGADVDFGELGIARAFGSSHAEGDDGDAFGGGGVGGFFQGVAGVGLAIGDEQDSGQRLAAIGGEGLGDGGSDAGGGAVGEVVGF